MTIGTQQESSRFLTKIYAKKAAIDRSERPRPRDFFGNNIIQWLLVGNIFIIASIAGLIAWFIRPSEIGIILHYNAFFGVSNDMIGPWWHAYSTVLFGTGLLIFNVIVAYIMYCARERIASYILLLGAFLVQATLLIVAFSIIIINR